jgi:hypothetical protein
VTTPRTSHLTPHPAHLASIRVHRWQPRCHALSPLSRALHTLCSVMHSISTRHNAPYAAHGPSAACRARGVPGAPPMGIRQAAAAAIPYQRKIRNKIRFGNKHLSTGSTAVLIFLPVVVGATGFGGQPAFCSPNQRLAQRITLWKSCRALVDGPRAHRRRPTYPQVATSPGDPTICQRLDFVKNPDMHRSTVDPTGRRPANSCRFARSFAVRDPRSGAGCVTKATDMGTCIRGTTFFS